MFFSCCFTKEELRYRSSKLEIVYLVWMYKRLCTLLYSNNHRIVVLTDHEVIRGIVHYNILNITFIGRVNRRLINASVYLSAYLLKIYYMSNRLNYISNILLRLRTMGDNVVRKSIVEPVLDVFWDEDPEIEVERVFFIFFEIYIDDIFR